MMVVKDVIWKLSHSLKAGGLWYMNDEEIKQCIINILKDTSYNLLSFERNHSCFGNMVAIIKLGIKKYTFISDRGDILCNGNVVFISDYHVAGEDDTPVYFLKAIEQLVR
jgi:hypothetical protein